MQATYKSTGEILEVYDETLHRHSSLLTVDLTEEQAQNIGLYRVDPNQKTLYLTPTCDKKYLTTVDNVILEMTAEEKAAVDERDAARAAAKVIADAQAAAHAEVQAAKAQDFLNNIPSWAGVSTAVDNIANLADAKVFIKKLARVVYWLAKDTQA